MRRLVGLSSSIVAVSLSACLSGIVSGCLVGCSWQKKDKDLNGEPVKVQIPYGQNGEYRLTVVELKTLNDLSRLDGAAAQFLIDPSSSSGRIKGRSPHLQYIRDSDDVVIPTDDLSLQLLTIYAHFEKLKELDEQVGASGTLAYPRGVAINARIPDEGGAKIDNAMYSPKYDKLLVVPFTRQTLPLMANGGVIGHEHFHSLFQKLLIEPLKDKYPSSEKPSLHDENQMLEAMGLQMPLPSGDSAADVAKKDERTQYHAVLFQGINEGLADVWGWVYSGDKSFVGRSLPEAKYNRDLDLFPYELFPRGVIQKMVSNPHCGPPCLLSVSYEHGTQLARSIHNLANTYALARKMPMTEVRLLVGQTIIQTLPDVAKEFAALKKDEYYTLSKVMLQFSKHFKNMNSNECFTIAKLMPKEDLQESKMDETCRELEKKENAGVHP